MKNKAIAALCVFLAATFWGSTGIFVRYFNGLGLQAMNVIFLRGGMAAILVPFLVLAVRPAAFRIRLRDIWCFIGTGVFSIIMFSYCYYRTIALTSLSVAAVLMYAAPVLVVLMSAVLFKERITWKKAFCCAVVFLGCILVGDIQSSAMPPLALLTGFLSALGYALYSIFSRLAMKRGYQSFTVILYTFWIASLGSIPLADIPAIIEGVRAGGTTALVMVFLMGLVTGVLPYAFYTIGLSGLEAGKASMMSSLELVMATVFGFLVFREVPSPVSLCGIVLVLVGVVLLNVRFKKV